MLLELLFFLALTTSYETVSAVELATTYSGANEDSLDEDNIIGADIHEVASDDEFMLKHVRGNQGFLSNLLNWGFEFGYGNYLYLPKMVITAIPYTILYTPVLLIDTVVRTVAPRLDNVFDCNILGNCNRQS